MTEVKGIVFTNFIEMVEQKFSLEVADGIITDAALPSGGSYTTVGTYSHTEMIRLVSELGKRTGVPVSDLIRTFGEYLFEQLVDLFPHFIDTNRSVFDFLPKVDSYIHAEVRKLYPDAELPSFSYEVSGPDRFVMVYRSARPFADLAEGLINGCIAYYGEPIEMFREELADTDGTAARFTLTKRG
ncbi:heme NO-binding domain-containing protein [Cohnella boryungensis]|uniref:Heme NO-binding domain-containing protein n=1 Tax=Cohnella boryungensis TaxID=768479 RepID=A0ABV8SDH4_9BACL